MAYVKTVWVDGQTNVNAKNLNHIENGLEELSNAVDEIETEGCTVEEVNQIVDSKGFTTEEEVRQMINASIITALNTEV